MLQDEQTRREIYRVKADLSLEMRHAKIKNLTRSIKLFNIDNILEITNMISIY